MAMLVSTPLLFFQLPAAYSSRHFYFCYYELSCATHAHRCRCVEGQQQMRSFAPPTVGRGDTFAMSRCCSRMQLLFRFAST